MLSRHRKLLLLAALAVLAGLIIPIGTSLQLQASPKKEKLSKKERKRQKRAREELEGGAYKHWIDEEVPYIITDQERAAWKKLSTDAEREQFIEAFWESFLESCLRNSIF